MIAVCIGIAVVVLAVAAETGVFGARTAGAPLPSGNARYVLSQYRADAQGGTWTPLTAGATPQRGVLLIHGLDEPGTIWDDLAPALAEAGHVVVRFDYPNDQPIADSGSLLQSALESLKADGCADLDLVCHSMGGLVARDALTRDAPGPVPHIDRLIMVGTPNHGSPLAPLRGVAEAREQIVRWARSLTNPPPMDAYLTDGEGEAGIDLAPGSEFLTALNARPMPADLRCTIIAGHLSPVTDEDARAFVDSSVLKWIAGDENVRAIGDAINLLGDGVVPLDSAMLEGVDDVVIVNANHRAILKRSALENAIRDAADAPGDPPPAIPIILDRLGRDDQE